MQCKRQRAGTSELLADSVDSCAMRSSVAGSGAGAPYRLKEGAGAGARSGAAAAEQVGRETPCRHSLVQFPPFTASNTSASTMYLQSSIRAIQSLQPFVSGERLQAWVGMQNWYGKSISLFHQFPFAW